MIVIGLSTEEVGLLHAYCRTSPLKLLRAKSQAVLLRSRKIKIKDIAFSLGAGYRTVERWIKDFSQTRMASIFSGHADNENASKLTRKQKHQIREVLKQPPSEYGLPKEFWDVPTLKEYVEARFGVVYESSRSYHFLLRFSNLSFKYPDTFAYQRDEELIKRRMKEIRKEVRPLMEDNSWEVFVADESRIILEALTRRAWLKKGTRTIIKVNRKREYQNYFGALNQKTFQCHVFEINWQNQDEVICALEKLIAKYPDKKIALAWDNVTFHKGKKIKEALKKGGKLERLHLINFPPYAPDMNPLEHVWNTVKGQLANIQFDSFTITKTRFMEKINSQKFPYQI